MFSEYLLQFPWKETTERIYSKTDDDVRRALSKRRLQWDDFLALISPAAGCYLETMARMSRKLTEERFGRIVNLFLPLYLTNSCANSCVYCGFHRQNKMKRIILTQEEMVREYEAPKVLTPTARRAVTTAEEQSRSPPAIVTVVPSDRQIVSVVPSPMRLACEYP